VSYGDLFPQATLKWNNGVNNYMVYGMMNLPVGDYNASRLVNISPSAEPPPPVRLVHK
jgi:hypothetical protein